MSQRRIVIADDNSDSAEMLEVLLRLRGHEVRCAADGNAAMQFFHQDRPDAMLVDITMPGIDGREVARRVRSEDGGRSVLLVAISGWARPSDVEESLASGFDHHLVKPVDMETLERLCAAE